MLRIIKMMLSWLNVGDSNKYDAVNSSVVLLVRGRAARLSVKFTCGEDITVYLIRSNLRLITTDTTTRIMHVGQIRVFSLYTTLIYSYFILVERHSLADLLVSGLHPGAQQETFPVQLYRALCPGESP